MASYTGNLNLKKPALDDDALITDINNNMDILDAAANGIQDALAIVANGNTHAAISAGQFVYVRNHSTLTEGLYVASSNIAANATLSTSNLTADSAGGLNALNGKIHFTDIEFGYGVGVADEAQITFTRQHSVEPKTVLAVNSYASPRFVQPYNVSSTGFNVYVKTFPEDVATSGWINWVAIWD